MSSLKFIAISGTTGVTENLYIYEYKDHMIVVDCGVGFPEQEMYGVDLVIPDFTYIRNNARRLRGIIVTHGHEDHFGALPFLLKDLKAPIYSTKLVAGFIKNKLEDYDIKEADIHVFNPERDVISLGPFKITPFRISHSVPDSVGFAIDTPEGKIFHVPDYKFDWTPVDGRPFDISKAANLAASGVLAVASDSLGSTTPGYTESEKEIEGRIEDIVRRAKGEVFFTTISSNISRMQQALTVAKKVGRKATFVGRSIQSKTEIAKNLGYMSYSSSLVVSVKQASKMAKNKVMAIISGCYGQPGSNLYRVAVGEHDTFSVEEGDVVIFSGDPAPPGTKDNVDFIVDRLIELKAEVHYYDLQEDLHVSGHGSQEDIKTLFALLRPKYFIPIGGSTRYNRAYKKLAIGMGAKPSDVFELKSGDIVEFKDQGAKISGNLSTKEVLVDGLGIGDVGNIVLRDRQVLATDGIAIVLMQIDRKENRLLKRPDIISRGFVFEKAKKGLLIRAAKELRKKIERKKRVDRKIARIVAIDFLEKYFYKETGRRPMILPLIVEV